MRKPYAKLLSYLMALLITISACQLQKTSQQQQSKSGAGMGSGRMTAATVPSTGMHSLYASGGRFEGFSAAQELLGKRAENAKHFRNDDGSYTVQIGGKMHYRGADGQWQDIDLSILEGSSLPGYAFRNETNAVKSYLPDSPGQTGVLMKLEDGTDFTWWSQPTLRIMEAGVAIATKTPARVEGIVSQEKLVYPEIYPQVSEEFVMLDNGMESSTILHALTPELQQLSATAQLEFEHFIPLPTGWQVYGDGQLKSGDFEADQLHIQIPGNENGIHFGRIVVFDNNISKDDALLVNMPAEKLSADQNRKLEESVHTLPYRIAFADQGIYVTTAITAGWLQEPARAFPVTIDPTVTITPENPISYFYGPMTHWYGYQRHASLYLQSEIGDYGLITQIEYNSTTPGTAGSRPTKVYMRSTSSETLSSGSVWNSAMYTGAGATLCLDANTDQGNTTGWKALPLTTPFDYENGNLLIMVADFWGGGGAVKYYNQSSTVPNRQTYSRADNIDPGDGTVMTLEQSRLTEIRITYTPIITCVGTLSTSAASVCPTTPVTLTLLDASTDPGTTFQWQSSTDGGTTWTDLGQPQTLPTYTAAPTETTDYRAIATCTAAPQGTTSNVVTVAMKPLAECYCVPAIDCSDNDVILNVTMGGIDNNSTCGNGGYTDYSNTVAPAEVNAGSLEPVSVSVGDGWSIESVMIWIDFNQNGIFEEGTEYFYIGEGSGSVVTGSVSIPASALPGTTRMRVMVYAGSPSGDFACYTAPEDFGEFEDYAITIHAAATKAIESVDLLDAIELACPTAFDDLTLPTTVTVSFDDDSTEEISVVWEEGDYETDYGSQTIVGVLDLPTNLTNPLDLTAAITINVTDEEDPEITCLADQTIGTDAGACTYTHSGTAWDATATDNCTVANITYQLTGATTGSGNSLDEVIFNLGETTVTWTATDAAGNTDVCSFKVTVTDETLPTVLTSNLLIALDANGQATITADMIDNGSSDDCGIATLALSKTVFDSNDLGSNTVTLTATDNNGNENTGTATVLVVAFDDASLVYDGTVRSLLLDGVLPTGVSASYANNGQTEAGTYTVTANINGGTHFNDLSLTAELEITKASLVGIITLEDESFVYDGTAHALAVTGTLPTGVTVSYVDNAQTEAGTHTVTANINGGNNYENLTLTATLEITKASLAGLITFNGGSFVYNGAPRSLAITGTLPAGASVSYVGNAQTEAGTHTVTANINGGNNYENLTLTATLEITKASLAGLITFNGGSFVYNGAPRSLAITGTLPAGATVSYVGNAQTEAGTHTVTANINGGNNYENLTLTATLTINKAEITGISLGNQSFVYDGQAKSLAISGTLPQGASVSYTNNSRTDAGTQTVTANINGGNNYNNSTLTATLTITPATRTLNFPAIADKTFGEAAFAAGATASTGETVRYSSSNTAVATVAANGQISIVGAGQVTITATLTDNANYTSNPVATRSFTVAKAAQTISHNIPAQLQRNAGNVPLTVSASSGLPVALAIDDTQVATLSGSSLNVLRIGTVRITLTQEGNANYLPAAPITVTVRVVDPTADFDVIVHQAVSPNGDGINDFLIIEGIRDYPDNKVTIFTKNGTLVYETRGYNNGSIAFGGIGAGGNNLPAGTYYYIVEVNVNGQWKHEKGFFVLRY